MKISLVFVILIFNATILFSQVKSQNLCVLNFDTKGLTIDRNKAEIEICKTQNDSVKKQVVIKTIKAFKEHFKIAFKVDAPFTGYIVLKYFDTLYNESSDMVFSNEQINCKITQKEGIVIKSKQNDFYSANVFLLFALPSTISRERDFSSNFVKQNYELEEPGNNPETFILLLKLKEYERNVLKGVLANKEYLLTIIKILDIENYLSPKTLDTCFSILNKIYRNTTYAHKLKDYIEQSKKLIVGKLVVGKNVPGFTSSDKDGKTIKSDSLYTRYDYTLLDFWASWCGPCRKKMRIIKKLYSNNIDTSKFQMVSVSIDDNIGSWLEANKQDTIIWKSYIAKGGWQSDVAKTFNLNFIPANILIDKLGKIVAFDIWDKDLELFLQKERLLKE